MPNINDKTYESSPAYSVAFLGLGVMGYPMAGHLARAGHQVTVYNRTAAKSAAWVQEFAATAGPRHATTPREAAAGADIVFCCVGNDDDLRGVTLGADVGINYKTQDFVAEIRNLLGAEGDTRKLTDITSYRRLELIQDMAVKDAYGYARFKNGAPVTDYARSRLRVALATHTL